MASLKETVLALLSDDGTLGTVFTGGFFDADNLPNDGLTLNTIPKEADGVTIRPTGVLRWRDMNPVLGPSYAARLFVEIYLYDDTANGRENIDYGKRRIWTLLNKKYIGDSDHEGLAYAIWAGDIGEPPGNAMDDALMANMDRMRFQLDMTRKTS